jgi:hypothetical protein
VVAAFLLAFVCHIDSLDIIKQLSISSEVRARLVQSADSTLKDAAETVAQSMAFASAALRATKADQRVNALPEANQLENIPDNLVTQVEAPGHPVYTRGRQRHP